MTKELPKKESFKPQYLYIEKERRQNLPDKKHSYIEEEEHERGILIIEII